MIKIKHDLEANEMVKYVFGSITFSENWK